MVSGPASRVVGRLKKKKMMMMKTKIEVLPISIPDADGPF